MKLNAFGLQTQFGRTYFNVVDDNPDIKNLEKGDTVYIQGHEYTLSGRIKGYSEGFLVPIDPTQIFLSL